MKDSITKKIVQALHNLNYDSEQVIISKPNDPRHGDYSTPVVLSLAKTLKKNPVELAKQIASAIETDDIIGKIDVLNPGFINIWLTKKHLIEVLINIQTSPRFGASEIHKGKQVIVEYSSPNIAKPFTIGHLRSTIIGDAIANILEATGYTVFRDNHVGDWGTQFGKLIYAIQTFGNLTDIEQSERPVKELVDLYVKFHDKAEKNPELDEEGRKWFKKLEDGDAEARELWEKCIEWSWKEFDVIYQKLGVKFTENEGRGYGESFFEDKMQAVVQELNEKLGPKGLYKESKGAHLVFFPDDTLPPFMILKQDGSTLYSTRDLATDKFRLTDPRYSADVTIVNEVGIEQSLYFKQLYETEQLLGWVQEGQRVHVKHGLYRFKDAKMSTRKGNTIWLEDVLEEVTKRAHQLGSNSTDSNLAEKIGMSALKWNDLKRSSHLDIVFEWDEILNMEGNSGPYMQYTYVRCKSILEKEKPSEKIVTHVMNEEEYSILRHLSHFPEVVADAAHNFAPNSICTYLFELAQMYNLFYQKHPILKADADNKNLRLALTHATAEVIKSGLELLGIQTVEKM